MRRQGFAFELRAWLVSKYIGGSRCMDVNSRYIYKALDGSIDNAVDFGLFPITLSQDVSSEQTHFARALPKTQPRRVNLSIIIRCPIRITMDDT